MVSIVIAESRVGLMSVQLMSITRLDSWLRNNNNTINLI